MGNSKRTISKSGLRLLWPILWAFSIYLTSSTVVTTKQLSNAVSKVAGGEITPSGFLLFWGAIWWLIVKGWHALEFAILYTLIKRALPKVSANTWIFLAILAATLDEIHQVFVPARGGRVSDICIDAIGVLGAWVYGEWRARKDRPVSPTLGWFFSRKWLMRLVILLAIALIFVLSFIPFGTMTIAGRY